jgi:hypothetical protein
MNSDIHFFLPTIWEEITDRTNFYGWNFLKPLIGKRVFWASIDWFNQHQNLPNGYEFYLIKTEGPNTDWIEHQAKLVDGKLVVMCLPKDYGLYDNHEKIIFLPCVEWHYQFDAMLSKFGSAVSKDIKKKVSVLTNRITYSKAIATAAVLDSLPDDDIFYSLHDWMELKNIHHGNDTSSMLINQYKNLFLEKFQSWKYQPDQELKNNDQSVVYNYHHPAYQECAINITNESWNYSLKYDKLLPGPFITEKTLKCLLGETAFIANGQFDTYNILQQFGFKFDYGLDLSYDYTQGDLSRLEGLISLIQSLKDCNTDELFFRTRESCLHNKELIVSKEFHKKAENFNFSSIEKLLTIVA